MNLRFLKYILPFFCAFILSSCEIFGPGQGIFTSPSPHEQYANSLKTANLDKTALGSLWLAASERSLRDSLLITLPYRESGYFPAQSPFALGYRVQAERGDVLLIGVTVQGRDLPDVADTKVFVDVFELDDRQKLSRVLSAKADTTGLRWEVKRSRMHLIRIQPELLRSGRYTLSITRDPLLAFPVQGRNSKQISSFWGANRDAGRRSHEGVDIFAPRGTPALAAIDGYVSRVGTNNLGGNVIFLSDQSHGINLYYAHLDSFNVAQGKRVQLGDTLGFVGNTGNARTTGTHLHFGIYESGTGAINPFPFIRLGLGEPNQKLPGAETLGDTVRLTTNSSLRVAPNSKATTLATLDKNQIVRVLGGSAGWLRVRTPTETEGYLLASAVREVGTSLRQAKVVAQTPVYDEAYSDAAVYEVLAESATLPVLGTHGNFELVELNKTGVKGWISKE
ncbi:peptidoglycan DD-metalloendopeptidase family protein [Salmonirosea aquatica]|uniref:Peptidoglycan DD-metalloendopeptidase family protein n=1 Tax=Salmonirosea aquatica TaxID=2654236 RepID=A0A7C9FYJ1_9BACT|nr:peptidoglycan DD-metalloendopeptidase family protein [Cytophagaceae bacterium SJW1-29]